MKTERTIEIPKQQFRNGLAEVDSQSGMLRMSISSDTPYLRYDWRNDEEYWEVLRHDAEGVDMSRLNTGASLLYNHDRDVLIGRFEKFDNNGKKLFGEAKISEAPDVASHAQKIKEGILKATSVGYSILDNGEEAGEKDGKPIYKFRWQPNEGSLVTVEADTTCGIGRRERELETSKERQEIKISTNPIDNQDSKEHKPPKEQKSMAEVATPPATEQKQDIDPIKVGNEAREEYKGRSKKIREFVNEVSKHKPAWREALAPIAEKHIDGDADFDLFRTEALGIMQANTIDTPHPDSKMGCFSKGDRRNFRLTKAILEASQGKLTGHEKEVCEAAAEHYHGRDSRQFSGLCIPDDMTRSNFAEDNDLGSSEIRELTARVGMLSQQLGRNLNVSNFSLGGALVGTDLLGGSMIDILRNAVLIGQGPLAITELGGLVGNIAIPKQTGTANVYWLSEGGSVTESDQTFAQLVMSPHRLGADTAYTKQLLAQASLSVEAFVRSDIAQAMAVEEDRATIQGTGLGGEPLGILNTSGVLSNVTFGGNASWGKIVALEYGLENANVRNGMMATLTSPLTKSYLKTTLQVASSTFAIYLWMPAGGEFPVINGVMPGRVNEYPAYATKNMTNQVLLGVFQNIFKARWAAFDVVVDPYTGKKTETIEITVNQWLDIGLRYPQSFNASTDAPTAPN